MIGVRQGGRNTRKARTQNLPVQGTSVSQARYLGAAQQPLTARALTPTFPTLPLDLFQVAARARFRPLAGLGVIQLYGL